MTAHTQSFGDALKPDRVLHVPTVWDGMSAKLAQRAGWDAIMVSGLGVAATLGLPDMDLYTSGDNLSVVRTVAACVETAVLADLDNGYGGPLTVARNVQMFEDAGASAMMMEDQASPKRCPFYPGEPPALVEVAEAGRKVRAAVETMADPGTRLIARTDARTPDEIFARGESFVRAGAHLFMPNNPDESFTLDHWAKLHAELGVGLVASALPGSRLEEELDDATCREVGIVVYIDALHGLYAAAARIQQVFSMMREGGPTSVRHLEMLTHHEFGDAMGEAAFREVQRRYEE